MILKWVQLYNGTKHMWWLNEDGVNMLRANPRAFKVPESKRSSNWGRLRFPPHDCILYIKNKIE